MRRFAPLGIGVLLALLVAANAQPRSAGSSTRIVPWVSIGAVHLLGTTAPADRAYGKPFAVTDVSKTVPPRTRWFGHHVVNRGYHVPGGELWLRVIDGAVRAVWTTSAQFSTPHGLHVGLKIPFGKCRRTRQGRCVFLWREFRFEGCAGAWRADQRRRLTVLLGVTKGRVSIIRFGDPGALFICF
jgi:hypothetical protein